MSLFLLNLFRKTNLSLRRIKREDLFKVVGTAARKVSAIKLRVTLLGCDETANVVVSPAE